MARILVVDDDAVLRDALSRMLRASGYEVVVSEDAKKAQAELAGAVLFDLVVSDYNMPGMNGLELYEWMRAQPALAEVPFILNSATPEVGQKCLSLGIPYFQKPFNARAFLSVVESKLKPP